MWCLLVTLTTSLFAQDDPKFVLKASLEPAEAAPGEAVMLVLRATTAAGWHAYGTLETGNIPVSLDTAALELTGLERAGEAPGLLSETAQEDAEKLRDEGLRLWGKLRAVGARGIAKAVEATKSWEDQARSKPSALEDLALSALDAGRYAKGVVEDEVRKKRDWAAQQARAALLERLEKALPDVDEKPQWVAACLQGEVTFDRVELVLTGSGVPPGPALVVEMLVVDGSDLGTLPPRRAMRILAKRLAEKALDALLDASPVDVIRLAAVVGAVTAAEAEKAATRAARDAASRARALADAAAREADERTRDFRRELAGYSR